MGIAFAPGEMPELFDVYQLDNGGKKAAALMLHGGGWRVPAQRLDRAGSEE